MRVYVEVGAKKVFAGALEWPGLCRGGRDEDAALEALVAYGPRYRAALAGARSFATPRSVSGLEVVERLKGNATTDFGVPGIAPTEDAETLTASQLKRQTELLQAAWSALDRSAEAARGATLKTGPRGGGRSLDAIVEHVFEADRSYLSGLGGRYRSDARAADAMPELRAVVLETIASRARGEAPPPSPRRTSPLWSPRYTVRRSAWHALDHAWEIEDRAS